MLILFNRMHTFRSLMRSWFEFGRPVTSWEGLLFAFDILMMSQEKLLEAEISQQGKQLVYLLAMTEILSKQPQL